MEIMKTVEDMQQWCLIQKRAGRSIGLVPTMGYLHEGHLALVRQARQNCDIVIVSIFVNPIQFGTGEDFDEYPRDLTRDSEVLRQERVDAIFAPLASDMYPRGFNTYVEVFGDVTEKLCARSRPGHFKGVTTVCSKLFHICQPDRAYFGQKDAQQLLVMQKMVRDLNFPLEIVPVPIVREPDGLAMSSRNVYLSPEERRQALVLYQSLQEAQKLINSGERKVETIKGLIRDCIESSPLARIDYIEIYDADDLSDIEEIDGRALIALAVKFGNTRLIDNLLVEV
ncbi:MAG TPA: pantoate--beta-alanine ligase [Syntrophomonadaceae bacterium]|nr:pantoate--beta-alanine ligase [Syntrophomonadaceae bacterium]